MPTLDPDWTLATAPAVEAVIVREARRLIAEHDYLEVEDVVQEARILAATNSALREVLSGEPNLALFSYRLRMDLLNLADGARRTVRPLRSLYLSAMSDTGEAEEYERPVALVIRDDVAAYDLDLVEALLPAAWDPSYCWGLRIENAPDADMPRAAANRATGNTVAVHIADMKSAWERAFLSEKQRRALFMRYALDWKLREIAAHEGVKTSTIRERLDAGLARLLGYLEPADHAQVARAA